jgi:hypothetical protein
MNAQRRTADRPLKSAYRGLSILVFGAAMVAVVTGKSVTTTIERYRERWSRRPLPRP